MHPFAALIRRYCIDYTNSHDTSWLPELMTDDYVVHIAGHDLRLDGSYRADVEGLFAKAPGLGMTVHQLYLNGDRLALRFSEHACFTDKGNALASWRGYATYRWDGRRLTECWVEQDFHSRHRQIRSRRPHAPPPPGIDPWMTPPAPEDPQALAAARAWLERFDLTQVAAHSLDDADEDPDWALVVTPEQVVVDDVFSCGRDAPFHARLTGPLAADPARRATVAVCGVVTVAEDGSIAHVGAVSDRFSPLVASR